MSAVDVCVLGSINMDLVVRAPRLPVPGETLLGGPWRQLAGGKGANQAVAAARLGARVALIGCVGDDGFGRALVGELERAGIRPEVRVSSAAPTGVALITVDDSGENTIVVAPGANARLDPRHVAAAAETIRSAAWLVAQLETPVESLEAAIRIAREADTRVLLNAAPARELPATILESLDVLVVNEGEGAQIAGSEGPAEAQVEALAKLGPRAVVMTLGARGALAFADGRVCRQAPCAVQVRDAVGAGDAFVGALACELARGATLAAALRPACAAGALATTRDGAQAALPTRAELEALLDGAH
ncbi:MAG: ribokinase [Planctomycetota bacterium]|nr:MAG: ribokinase [Planctomycetota bacterium]